MVGTECLPKKGNGKWASQTPAKVAEACSDENNVACVGGARCDEYKVLDWLDMQSIRCACKFRFWMESRGFLNLGNASTYL